MSELSSLGGRFPRPTPVTFPVKLNRHVNANISDLFFNTDHDLSKLHDARGNFAGFDPTKLGEEADLFLACLRRLGVAVPDSESVVADFLGRI